MRKLIALVLSVLLCCGAWVVCQAAAPLSPALSSMTEEVELVKGGLSGRNLFFCEEDFAQALGVRRFGDVTVRSLPAPAAGTLYFGKTPVATGQVIPQNRLSALCFVPHDNSVREGSFTFSVGDLAGGAEIACLLRFTDCVNLAPAAAGAAVQTLCGVSCFGTLTATDPEGDALTYRIVSYPQNGTLTLTDRSTGTFRYTPQGNFLGEDTFRFTVRDVYGNWSPVSTVKVQVKKNALSYTFADMTGTAEEVAALELAGKNILQGKLKGADFYFLPDGTVTRGEFTVMAMKAASVSPIPGLTETCFDDNDKIDPAERPYIAAAQRYGIVYGAFADGALCFDATRPITQAEAMVILCRLLDAPEPTEIPTFAQDSAVPVWAQGAAAALYQLGVVVPGDSFAPQKELTRRDAAAMLWRAMNAE